MLKFSFRDLGDKRKAYCKTQRWNPSPIIDASPAKSAKVEETLSSLSHRNVNGKKPMYREFTEKIDMISVVDVELALQTQAPEAFICSTERVLQTPFKCTCTPSDAQFALQLYLQSTKKQHKQLEHSLRAAGGLRYFLSTSDRNGKLVKKLSGLYSTVEELHRLVMAEEIVSSVTLTEIHRLMDNALTPVSQQVSALYGEMMGFSVANDRWKRRMRLIDQRMKEDWEPRMRALVLTVDQADAWAQLAGIRITRVGFEW